MKARIMGVAITISSLLICNAIIDEQSKTMQVLQILHEKIGGTLIKVSKKHSDVQKLVYITLDRVNTMRDLCIKAINAKKDYKRQFQKKEQEAADLTEEIRKLRNHLSKTEKNLTSLEKKRDEDKEQFIFLRKENDLLQKTQKKLSEFRKKYTALEESIKSNFNSQPNQHPSSSDQQNQQASIIKQNLPN